MGGQRHQSSSMGSALFDNPGHGSLRNAGPASDTRDAVTVRWLQSAGLQHLAPPLSSSGIDHHLFPNHRMQGYGTQSVEENQELFKSMRNMDFNAELGSDPCTLTAQTSGGMSASDGFHFSDFKGEFGAGLLDLHAMDDSELLTENVISEEPFELSPYMVGGAKAVDNDYNVIMGKKQMGHTDTDTENIAKESNVAKIKVVVRKRPLNKKELSRREDDIVSVSENAYLTVHETKLKVDLTAYLERHEFCFDAVLDEHVTNDEVYRETVQPIIPTIFQRTKATCFAYGQTGSGKTFTMQPLPIRAADDIVRLLYQPTYRNQKLKLWLSYFEIYGGKLFDLLNNRKKLCMREDGRQQVCIVGLEEFEILDVQIVKEYIEKGNASRSTGSTGANEESSRSHAILQLAVKKPNEIKDNRRNNDGNESKSGKVLGKISFIDLAGSERGADTTDNDRQTRIEGAEINKSLLALKECIRALDNDQIHIPFRGSKLTEVLRDSFVGNSRTVMISCVSPNAGSCEHTLNTLRYADRVKSLSKSGNVKKDISANSLPSTFLKESVSNLGIPVDADDESEQHLDTKITEKGIKGKDSLLYGKRAPIYSSSIPLNGREESGLPTFCVDKETSDPKNALPRSASQKMFVSYSRGCADMEENVHRVSPTRRKPPRDEKTEMLGSLFKKDGSGFVSPEQHNMRNSNSNNAGFRASGPPSDGNVTVLEEEVALIAAHRDEIEETMEIVREEMKLLAEVEVPGSVIDNYVGQLSLVLSRKAAGLVSLQARLTRFQHRLKEHEILSRKRVPR